MEVYERNECSNFTYPDEMQRILDYLNRHGKIFLSYSTVESLYYDFSEKRYCTIWMPVDDLLLEEFEEWLTEKYI